MTSIKKINQLKLEILNNIFREVLDEPKTNQGTEYNNLSSPNNHISMLINDLTNPIIIDDEEKAPGIKSNLMVSHQGLILENKLNKRCQNKYRRYTLECKQSIVEEVRRQLELSPQRPLSSIFRAKSREYSISRRNIRRWYQAQQLNQRKIRKSKPAFPAIEEKLAQFMKKFPEFTRKDLIQLAQSQLKKLNVPESKKIKFSKGWYERFKARMMRKEAEIRNQI